jgi:hypothetical protein
MTVGRPASGSLPDAKETCRRVISLPHERQRIRSGEQGPTRFFTPPPGDDDQEA